MACPATHLGDERRHARRPAADRAAPARPLNGEDDRALRARGALDAPRRDRPAQSKTSAVWATSGMPGCSTGEIPLRHNEQSRRRLAESEEFESGPDDF